MSVKKAFLGQWFLLTLGTLAIGQSISFKEVARFDIPEARQGVAVDENHFYAVSDRQIGKYEKDTGRLVKRWVEPEGGPMIHLDSGVVVDGRLYAAHSNYPEIPMTSSVEIWDTESMEHIGSHSFGIRWGSFTWLDRHGGYWWAGFAHYNKLAVHNHTDNRWTTLVKFDDDWRALESWVYPTEVIQRFDGMSNSGGSWGPDGRLYCTGHDHPELYVLEFPRAGSRLELVETIPIDNTGQGIAWDRSNPGTIYTIRKADRQVVVFEK
jgi:hypothetical protein